MRVVGNVIWFLTAGLWLALAHLVTGLLLCLTIIGIPFGVASFKMAGLAVAPLGRQVVPASLPGAGTISVGMRAGTPGYR